MPKWTVLEENSLVNDINFLSKNELLLKYKRKYDTIRKKANLLGIEYNRWNLYVPRRRKKLDIKECKLKYKNGKTLTELAKEYRTNIKTLSDILKENDTLIRQRKYNLNENFFEKINNEKVAYWFGFIMADGCVSGNMVQIDLSSKDIEIIEQFKQDIETESPIKTSKRKNSKIRLYSEKLSHDLKIKGCVERKSLILEFPSVPEFLLHHFMRGFFDGDGCIKFTRNRRRGCVFEIYSTENFTLSYQNILMKKLNLNKTKLYKRKNKNVFVMSYSGINQIKKIYNFLYKDATIFLKRKKSRFDYLINLK